MAIVTDLTPLPLPAEDAWLDWITASTADTLTATRTAVDALKSDPPEDALATLEAWNDISIDLGLVSARASLFGEVHPDEEVRTASDKAMQDVQQLDTELGLDRDLYEVFARLDPAGLDADARRVLDKALLGFRRSGVDKDEATRDRIRAIQERLVVVGQDFGRNIREGVRTVTFTPEQLDGMPQDWIDAHPVGDDGLVRVTTDYPDSVPFRTFAKDAAARRELAKASLTIAYPANLPLLQELFALRQELAELLGYASWADYDAEVKMIGDGPAIAEFIERITAAAEEPGRRDVRVLLDRLRQDHPDATTIDGADVPYYAELIRKEQLDVDAQEVRTFLDFTAVRQGLLDVTGRLFGLTWTPVPDAATWHEDVTCYEVTRTDDASQVGRLYLDLHPREGKFKHAAQFTLVSGIAGRHLPEGALVCNMPRALMEHDDVVTLFHEFGHLVHHLIGGHQRWARFSGVATEWDFVEAPSQMLEEWAWDADVLRTFARNASGEAIGADLVDRMRRADDFGKGYQARTQMFYAALSYHLHREQPDDIRARTAELQARYSLFPYIEGTCMPTSFGHLDGYSTGYYTYMWSLVIAKDLFSAFDPADLFDPEIAGRYRDRILAQGGRKDAADLVEDFLGRPYTFDAYAAWLAS